MTIWRYKTNTITSSLIGVTSRSFIENAVDEAVKNSFSSSINPSFCTPTEAENPKNETSRRPVPFKFVWRLL